MKNRPTDKAYRPARQDKTLCKKAFESVGRFSIRWAQKNLKFFSNFGEPMT
jgi:hypothetical protein